MISPEEKEKLKEHLPGRYAAEVKKILLQNGIYVKGVETYSSSHITNVLHGLYDNQDIENAFYTLYEQRKAAAELLKSRKDQLLTKKPVSANSQA